MAATESSSSSGAVSWAMLSGATSPGPAVVAGFGFGGNGTAENGEEYSLQTYSRRDPLASRSGRLTWDPLFGAVAKPFTCSAQVNLDVSSGLARWSAGTSPMISCPGPELRGITQLEFDASASGTLSGSLVRWDLIEVTLIYADGGWRTELSPCLPRVAGAEGVRRASAAAGSNPADPDPAGSAAPSITQHAQLRIRTQNVVRVLVRGQFSLRAAAGPVGPDDLAGRVLVFGDGR